MVRRTAQHSQPRRASRPRSDEAGFILVTVLLVIAILLPLVLAFSSKVQVSLLQAENFLNSAQAVRLARSGVEGAMALLRSDDPTYDTRKDTWAFDFPAIGVGEGTVDVKIEDEDGKIPINQLVLPNGVDVNRDVEKRLRALVGRLGERPEIVDALIDWIDTNEDLTGTEGAEEEYYKELGYHCKNGPLDSLEELSLVKGFEKDLLVSKNFLAYVTAAPTDGKINVNTAPVEVLHAVLGTQTTALAQPLNESDVEDLVRHREEHEFKTPADVNQVVKVSAAQAGNIAALIKVNSAYFTVHSKCLLGKVVYNAEALLKRDGNTVVTLSWREF
jgi:general secretion pathway protein K